jgi:hypothetical protein
MDQISGFFGITKSLRLKNRGAGGCHVMSALHCLKLRTRGCPNRASLLAVMDHRNHRERIKGGEGTGVQDGRQSLVGGFVDACLLA